LKNSLVEMATYVMSFSRGLTTWVMRLGPLAVIWRWNMRLREAVRTLRVTSFDRHLTAGPPVVEW
jgi:hypothetical protein